MSRRASLLAKQNPRKARVRFSDELVFQDNVKENDIEAIHSMLRRSSLQMDINLINTAGLTALHQAVLDGNLDAVRLLLEHGANINIQDEDTWTPLHAACAEGHAEIAMFLLQKGADPRITNEDDERPIDLVDPTDFLTISVMLKDLVGVAQKNEPEDEEEEDKAEDDTKNADDDVFEVESCQPEPKDAEPETTQPHIEEESDDVKEERLKQMKIFLQADDDDIAYISADEHEAPRPVRKDSDEGDEVVVNTHSDKNEEGKHDDKYSDESPEKRRYSSEGRRDDYDSYSSDSRSSYHGDRRRSGDRYYSDDRSNTGSERRTDSDRDYDRQGRGRGSREFSDSEYSDRSYRDCDRSSSDERGHHRKYSSGKESDPDGHRKYSSEDPFVLSRQDSDGPLGHRMYWSDGQIEYYKRTYSSDYGDDSKERAELDNARASGGETSEKELSGPGQSSGLESEALASPPTHATNNDENGVIVSESDSKEVTESLQNVLTLSNRSDPVSTDTPVSGITTTSESEQTDRPPARSRPANRSAIHPTCQQQKRLPNGPLPMDSDSKSEITE